MAEAVLRTKATLDASQFTRGMAEVKASGAKVAEQLESKNRETLKSIIGLGAPLALAVTAIRSMAGAFRSASEAGAGIRKAADAAGISAQSYIALKASAESAGLSAEKFNSELERVKSGAADIDSLTASWVRTGSAIERVNSIQKMHNQLLADASRNSASSWFERNVTSGINFAISSMSGSNTTAAMQSIIAAKGGNVDPKKLASMMADYANSNWIERLFNGSVSEEELAKQAESLIEQYKSDIQKLRKQNYAQYFQAAGGDADKAYDIYTDVNRRTQPNTKPISKDEFRSMQTASTGDLIKAINDASSARKQLQSKSVRDYDPVGVNSYGGDMFGLDRYNTYAGYAQAQRDAEEEKLAPVTSRIDQIAAILRGDEAGQ